MPDRPTNGVPPVGDPRAAGRAAAERAQYRVIKALYPVPRPKPPTGPVGRHGKGDPHH